MPTISSRTQKKNSELLVLDSLLSRDKLARQILMTWCFHMDDTAINRGSSLCGALRSTLIGTAFCMCTSVIADIDFLNASLAELEPEETRIAAHRRECKTGKRDHEPENEEFSLDKLQRRLNAQVHAGN